MWWTTVPESLIRNPVGNETGFEQIDPRKNQRRPFLSTPASALTAVSLVPSLDLAYLTALVSDPGGGTTASSFWTVGDGQPWSPE
jgi:hypothetical protein